MRHIKRIIESIGKTWCYIAHHDLMYAGGRDYECCKCQRRYPVGWAR
jgi:hypothetical protein